MARAARSLGFDLIRAEVLAIGQVVPDSVRCVQCGICSYNCPIGLDVCAYAWRGEPINDARCLTCGQCLLRVLVDSPGWYTMIKTLTAP